MDENDKTKEQLLEELEELRRRVVELEATDNERRRMKKALERGVGSLQTLLEDSLDIVALLNADATVKYISPSVEKMTGYEPEELKDKYIFDFIHPDDIESLLSDFLKGIEVPGFIQKREFRYRHKEGSWHSLETTGINLLDDPAVAAVILTGRDVTDRKRMEIALKDSEEKYRALIESQAVGISEVDRQDRFIFANQAAHSIFGVPLGGLIGRSLEEFTDEENYALIQGQTKLRETGIQNTYDVVIIRSDRERRTLRVAASPRLDEDGKLTAIMAVFSDITERKRAEEELRESEERYRLMYDHLGEAIFTYAPDLTLIGINKRACELCGYNEEELLGRNVLEVGILHPDDFRETEFDLQSLFSEGKTITDELRFTRKDGSVLICEVTGAALHDQEGNIIAITNVARDITESKEAEEALRQSELYYKSLIKNAGDMVSILNEDQTFRWGSPSTARITGYGPEDIYGKSVYDFIHPHDIHKMEIITEFIMKNPGVPKFIEDRFRHKDGTYHYHEAIVNNLLDDPSVQGIIINSRDITERKLIEEQLKARNIELDAFAYSVSHDLRTPLSLIEGYAQLIQSDDTTETEMREYLNNIIDASRRLDEMTESLLQYAQAGQPEGKVARIDANEVVREVLLEQAEAINREGVEVILGELPPILVDEHKIRQVFSNLVGNALKYLGGNPQPRIEIDAEMAGDIVTLYVRDNGKGMDKKAREEAFLPFKRFGSATVTGLGIGLSTVKRAVEGWGGKVWVDSRPGEGSTFFFTASTAEEA
jgi:PAS domain S-box-containing protein